MIVVNKMVEIFNTNVIFVDFTSNKFRLKRLEIKEVQNREF